MVRNIKFIAEFTTNHMGNLNILLEMVKMASWAGADYIKMQKKDVKSFYSKKKLDSEFISPYGKTYYDYRKIFEFNERDFNIFDEECKKYLEDNELRGDYLRILIATKEQLGEGKSLEDIFGKDKDKKYIKLISRYGLEESIKIFHGHDNVPQLMREAAALIHPARYENTGLILIEALSQNLPIITTDNC